MAKRKAKRKSNEEVEAKTQAKTDVDVNSQFTGRVLPFLIIGVAAVIFIVIVATMTTNQGKTDIQNNQLAPPMTGVEKFVVGQMAVSQAALSTFKLEELSGTDCVNTIVTEFRKLNGIAVVRADYSNKLLEVKYDPAKVTPDQIVEALKKADHPGQLTNQFINSN